MIERMSSVGRHGESGGQLEMESCEGADVPWKNGAEKRTATQNKKRGFKMDSKVASGIQWWLGLRGLLAIVFGLLAFFYTGQLADSSLADVERERM